MKPTIDEGNFRESINQAIREGRHVEYLQNVIKEYERYLRKFEAVFTERNPENAAYTFLVTYLSDKPIWRIMEVCGTMTFESFAVAIIKSMEWANDHLHGFELLGKGQKTDHYFRMSDFMFFAPDWEDDPHPTFKTHEIAICDIDYRKQPKLGFMFDFGDGHQFIVEFKGIREQKKGETSRTFPRVVDQRGVAPEQYPIYDEEDEE